MAEAFSSQVASLGGVENAITRACPSQVESPGHPDDATKQGLSVVPLSEREWETHFWTKIINTIISRIS
jgi:hypothetical protein